VSLKDDCGSQVESLARFGKAHGAYGLIAFVVTPDGKAWSHSRLIAEESMEEMNDDLFRFYTDDLMYAFMRALERERGERPNPGA
jgi:hypothetical protein